MSRPQHLLIAVTLLAIPLASSALANGPSTRPFKDRPFKDRPCLSECRGQASACLDAARTDARMCAQTTCSTELAKANEACEADPRSDDCLAARRAAYDCLAPCRETFKTALTKCREGTSSCIAGCPDRQPTPVPTPKDTACVSGCREALHTCQTTAQGSAQECRSKCADLIAAARTACGWRHHRPLACRDAQQAVYDCVHPCDTALATATRSCLGTANDCVASCPDASQSGGQP